jgi:WD40 repeat protein
MSLRNEPHQLAHEQHKVPVTSLQFYSDELLLAGEGTHLVAYSTSQRIKLGAAQIFRSQAIHRILINQTSREILICGGSHVAFAKVETEDGGLVTFLVLAQKDVGDWIFNAAFSPRSEYDSATTVALVTAHNALIKCVLEKHQEASDLTNILTEIVVPGSNCILYCAHISWLGASLCLVASGTAFGDIILWSSPFSREKQQTATVKTHYIFQAHEGSVFDVQISTPLQQDILGGPHRVLASCSDDRTIRLWDVSDLDRESPSMTEIQRETGLGSTDQSNIYAPPLLAKATGHISRIWMIRFILEEAQNQSRRPEIRTNSLAIASFGEDGSCITWNVGAITDHTNTNPMTYELRQSRILPIHAGKNIWSSTICNGHGATGGADGLIALLPSITSSSQEFEISDSLLSPSPDGTNAGRKDAFQSYTFVSADTILATTTQGHIVTLWMCQDGTSLVERHGSYESISTFSMTTSGSGLGFIAGIRGDALMFSLDSRRCSPVAKLSGKVASLFLSEPATTAGYDSANEANLLITTVGSATAQLVRIGKAVRGANMESHTITEQRLALASRFVATSFVLIRCGNIDYAIVGARNGSLTVYNLSETNTTEALSSTYSLQRCHGKDSVTAMQFRPATGDGKDSGHLFSTGRDGTCAVHRVTSLESSLSLELVHQLELPFGPNIEGLKFNEDDSLRIWGFKGKRFVVHDLKFQQDVFTVECGGGVHRNWAYEPSAHGGTFIWTQASTLMRVTQSKLPLQSLSAGGHGREIKAVAISTGRDQIIATGAEDTDIKLSTYCSYGSFSCLQTLRKHNTGIQHLQWSADGSRLFSSAGSEEFYVWHVYHDVPTLGVGVICESVHPRSMSSDLRIMGFDVSERVCYGQQGMTYEIVMAYSDSTIQRWSYDCSKWSSRGGGDYLTACLTDVRSLSLEYDDDSCTTSRLLTTATDGHIALWESRVGHGLNWLSRQKVHQNAVLDATLVTLSDASTLLVTAGDDNGIGFSRVHAERFHRDGEPEIATLLVPRAHAAAVTALAMYRYDKDCFYVLSASIDQRVKLWDVRVVVTARGVDRVKVSKVQNAYTSVADVSSMALLQLEDGCKGVLVCGVGMDVWRLRDGVTAPKAADES